jgi:prepilin-type N-terminal cleavage/methylation domain-containing protein
MKDISQKNKKKLRGMTIVEMLVAIAIFTIGIEGFSLLFIRAWTTNSFTLEMGQASMTASQGVSKITNYVRGARQGDNGAYPISSIGDNDLVIFSDYDKDGVTERLHLYKNGESVIMGFRDPSGTIPRTYAAGDQGTVTIASHVINDASAPIFSYYNENYPGDTINNPLTASSANINNVRLVKIHLKININPNRAPDNIETQSFAEIRNLNN